MASKHTTSTSKRSEKKAQSAANMLALIGTMMLVVSMAYLLRTLPWGGLVALGALMTSIFMLMRMAKITRDIEQGAYGGSMADDVADTNAGSGNVNDMALGSIVIPYNKHAGPITATEYDNVNNILDDVRTIADRSQQGKMPWMDDVNDKQ